MSASLVGSEMCIRDSPRSQRQSAIRSRPASAVSCLPHNRFKRLDTEPVSYTHLTLPTICSV
eukprot:12052721-Alexandrium_andersonii.AAC.1